MVPRRAPVTTTRRQRLDAALVERGLVATRARAQAAVLAGEVYVDGQRASKAGMPVAPEARLEIRSTRPRYVSRGGIKLDHALEVFGVEVAGRRAADIGASTGGFTDCLLARGAARVYAVDVGTGQLDWRLRGDPRVVCLERHDVRDLAPEALDGPVDLVTVDVSFISLGKVLPAVRRLVREGGTVVALVKPQFEAGPKAAKKGVVRDPAVHRAVLARVAAQAAAAGFTVLGATYSPIAGPDGNLEFFLHLGAVAPPDARGVGAAELDAVVAEGHARVARRGAGR
jgi:23S rRNA (cytidine1920-2'-O)/16S rRNA (cytidine1409-2'-O)-methyltransferase